MNEWELDQIHIRNLEVFGRHGVFPEENRLGQKFIINATLYLSTRQAGLKDDLTKSVHYGEVSHFMTSYMTEHTFGLIETAAEQMARATLLHFPAQNPGRPLGFRWKPFLWKLRVVGTAVM